MASLWMNKGIDHLFYLPTPLRQKASLLGNALPDDGFLFTQGMEDHTVFPWTTIKPCLMGIA
jgi:hypothetical protein